MNHDWINQVQSNKHFWNFYLIQLVMYGINLLLDIVFFMRECKFLEFLQALPDRITLLLFQHY